MHVLVIDDEPLMLTSLRVALEAEGWRVTQTLSAVEGLDRARTGAFDVVLLDIWMPEQDGIAVLKALRAHSPEQRVIAMTGGGPTLPTEVVDAIVGIWGAEQLFLKPFDEARLIAAIRAGSAGFAG